MKGLQREMMKKHREKCWRAGKKNDGSNVGLLAVASTGRHEYWHVREPVSISSGTGTVMLYASGECS